MRLWFMRLLAVRLVGIILLSLRVLSGYEITRTKKKNKKKIMQHLSSWDGLYLFVICSVGGIFFYVKLRHNAIIQCVVISSRRMMTNAYYLLQCLLQQKKNGSVFFIWIGNHFHLNSLHFIFFNPKKLLRRRIVKIATQCQYAIIAVYLD